MNGMTTIEENMCKLSFGPDSTLKWNSLYLGNPHQLLILQKRVSEVSNYGNSFEYTDI